MEELENDIIQLRELFFEDPWKIEDHNRLEELFTENLTTFPIDNFYILIKKREELLNPDTVVLLGESDCKIDVNTGKTRISVCNNSKIVLTASGIAIVELDLHHNSEAYIEALDNAIVFAKRYNSKIKTTTRKDPNAKIIINN